jgi:hypothetical protein
LQEFTNVTSNPCLQDWKKRGMLCGHKLSCYCTSGSLSVPLALLHQIAASPYLLPLHCTCYSYCSLYKPYHQCDVHLSFCLQEFTQVISNRYLQDWKKRGIMCEQLLSDKTLAEVRRERLNYTQLLYR